MALFGFNYAKPGPGVSKDGPQKKAFFHFFDIYGRKFFDLIKVNLLYLVSVILFYIPMAIMLMGKAYGYPIYYLSLLPIALTGPATAGFTFILRNFSREEHAFLWMDYRDTAKKNWKQSIPMTLINIYGISIILFIVPFYFKSISKNALFIIPFVISVFAAIIFLFMQYYLPVMQITFNLSLKQIYKNALIFAFLGLGRNIVITFFSALVIVATIYFIPLAFVLVPLISLSTIGLIINFGVWPVIQKYMIDNNPYIGHESQGENVPIFEDTTGTNVNNNSKS